MQIDIETVMSTSSSGYGSLSRTNATTKNPIPRAASAFGSTLTMYKEDHERERVRWQQKLDDTESRLSEAEIIISEMNQIKAELNKKIVEMERNQKPLIEQNRRLAERNRILQNEIKKGEQKLCHSQDGFLTLKSNYEKLMKENLALREKRASPEKLEELDRYRNQVLECSKCITALRQSSMEKDRRYDLLMQKFKRIRKCILQQRKNGETDEDVFSSFGGSDCSWDSTISLNTIAEDLREPLNRISENASENLCITPDDNHNIPYLQKIPGVSNDNSQYCLNDKSYPHSSDDSSRRSPQYENAMYSPETVQRLQNQVISMQEKIDLLQAELTDAKEASELFEFQLLENNEDTKHKFEELLKKREQAEKGIKTEDTVSDMDVEAARQCSSTMDTHETKTRLEEMIVSSNLNQNERAVVIASRAYIDTLEKTAARIDRYILQMKEKEIIMTDLKKEVENLRLRQGVEKQQREQIEGLEKKLEEVTSKKQIITEEAENLKKMVVERDAAMQGEKNNYNKLLQQMENLKAQTSKEITKMKEHINFVNSAMQSLQKEYQQIVEDKRRLLKESADLSEKLRIEEAEVKRLELEVRPAIRSELERRFEESRYRLQCALNEKRELEDEVEKLKNEITKLEAKTAEINVLRTEIEEHREYAEQLEKQFSAQVAIIEALKAKLLEQKATGTLVTVVDQSNSCNDTSKKINLPNEIRGIRGSDEI